ncbi:hypothetical protein M5K25_026508 [Dendrobium thyrsiflorum]|uniref:Uncharacterized protein n=1 Tax=Dendrobium thyrsiflorum TaxID=117978 RepID=A0ABD0TXP4_DENTH
MDDEPITILWFHHPGPLWFLVYLVRGGLRVIGEHTGSSHDYNLVAPFGGKPPGLEGPSHNRLSAVPFDGKTVS